jgi:hypothetical protein
MPPLFLSIYQLSFLTRLKSAFLESIALKMSPARKSGIFMYSDFDIQALCRRASELRMGTPCICNPDQRPASGSFNWAIFLTFEDGVRWVFRSPRNQSYIMPMETSLKLLASEAATLRYIKSHSDIPIPEVYHYWYEFSHQR